MNVSTFAEAADWTGWQLRYPVWHAYHSLGQGRTCGGDDLRRSVRGSSMRHLNAINGNAAVNASSSSSRQSVISLDSVGRTHPQLSRVKALVANLGNVLGYDRNSRTNWFDDRTEPDAVVSFNDFVEYFDASLLSLLQTHQGGIADKQIEEVENLCWLLARSKYLEDRVNRPSRVLSDLDARRLWDVFNFFAEEEPTEDEEDINLFMDQEEVGLVIQNLMTKLGKGFDAEEFDDLTEATPAFDFFLFLNPLEIWYLHDQEAASVAAVVKDLWLEIKADVVKRGSVSKRGLAVTGWKRRWLTLTPGAVEIHASEAAAESVATPAENNNNNNNNSKTIIKLNTGSSVESLPANTRLGPFAVPHAFCLKGVVAENPAKETPSAKDKKDQSSKKTTFEFSVGNFREKNEWMAAIRNAIENRGRGNQSVHRKQFLKRRAKRRKAAEAEAEMIEMKEQLRRKSHVVSVDLEMEKKKRQEEEEEKERVRLLHEEEKKRREELQTVNAALEQLLDEERNLRRDEELVRSAQARFIADELEAETDVVQTERFHRELAQVKLEKEKEISDALLKEKWAVERELDAARQELDAIESSRDVAEKKLQLLMRKYGIQRLPSSRGGSITAAEEDDDDDDEDEGDAEMQPDSVDGAGDEDATRRRTSGINGSAIFPSPSVFPCSDDDVFFLSDSSEIVLSPLDVTATSSAEDDASDVDRQMTSLKLVGDSTDGSTRRRADDDPGSRNDDIGVADGAPMPLPPTMPPTQRGNASSRFRHRGGVPVAREGGVHVSSDVDEFRPHAAPVTETDSITDRGGNAATTQPRTPAAAAAAVAAAACFPLTTFSPNYESPSEETPPALNNGKSASAGLVRRSSTLKTGEINLKKKLIIRRNSSRVGREQKNLN